jgi:endonuclease YncB( thermonuclease family)
VETAVLPLSLLSALALSGYGFGWTGRVVDISDGGTMPVLYDGEEVKVMLAGIDVSEKGHPLAGRPTNAYRIPCTPRLPKLRQLTRTGMIQSSAGAWLMGSA